MADGISRWYKKGVEDGKRKMLRVCLIVFSIVSLVAVVGISVIQ